MLALTICLLQSNKARSTYINHANEINDERTKTMKRLKLVNVIRLNQEVLLPPVPTLIHVISFFCNSSFY